MLFTEKRMKRQPSEAQREIADKMLAEVGGKDTRAVSFRAEEVLFSTPFLDECGLYMFMEEEYSLFNVKGKKTFTELRIAAAEAAANKLGSRSGVTLAKIYEIFRKLSGVSPDGAEKLMQKECELIEGFACPREFGKALFREAKAAKKRVIAVSESVYPREVVEEILERCGYGAVDGLVIVSETDKRDAMSWYKPVLEKAGVSPSKLLHCASGVENDLELAITSGSRAIMLAPQTALMERSGRLAGYIRDQLVYTLDTPEDLTLQCLLGLYASYGFDIPQNKVPLSDFCGDFSLLGFIVAGASSLLGEDFSPNARQRTILEALRSDEKALDGKDDFDLLFSERFGDFLGKFGAKDCDLPLRFVEKYCSASDREFFRPYASDAALKKWGASVKEPKLVEYSAKPREKGALDRLADRMFPPGTKVRDLTENILKGGRKRK